MLELVHSTLMGLKELPLRKYALWKLAENRYEIEETVWNRTAMAKNHIGHFFHLDNALFAYWVLAEIDIPYKQFYIEITGVEPIELEVA